MEFDSNCYIEVLEAQLVFMETTTGVYLKCHRYR